MTGEQDGLTLRTRRVLRAPGSRVFRALTEPEELAKWWGPQGFTVPSIHLDLWVGGGYRFGMQPPEGDLFYLAGEFRQIDRPHRLSYTFRWEDPDPDDQETVVTLTLDERGDSTELGLVQGPFRTEERHSLHDQGWSDSLDKLESLL